MPRLLVFILMLLLANQGRVASAVSLMLNTTSHVCMPVCKYQRIYGVRWHRIFNLFAATIIHEVECVAQCLVHGLLLQKVVHESHIHIIVVKQRTCGYIVANFVVSREYAVDVIMVFTYFEAQKIKNIHPSITYSVYDLSACCPISFLQA
jgi:hypothetical protein